VEWSSTVGRIARIWGNANYFLLTVLQTVSNSTVEQWVKNMWYNNIKLNIGADPYRGIVSATLKNRKG
jgi:hypothetical protein